MALRGVCAVIFSLMASSGWAQEGLRSASLPERTPMSPPPAERGDLYKAQPDTYMLHRSRLWVRPYFPVLVWPNTDAWPSRPARQPEAAAETAPARPALAPPPPALPAPPAPPTPAGPPKTFYVIPGCYAGDRPPRSEMLREGCDIARMRLLPPGAV